MPVEFDEENKFNEGFVRDVTQTGSIANWLVKNKIARDENGAKKIMLIIAIICFAVAIIFAVK